TRGIAWQGRFLPIFVNGYRIIVDIEFVQFNETPSDQASSSSPVKTFAAARRLFP
ncbi:MAG: hypothetical protein ACI8XW_002778, partial [Gammaproteobacteria bacterium]